MATQERESAQLAMAEDDFKRGESKAKLDRIEKDVVEIKADVKDMNIKIDDVEKSSDRAAVKAEVSARKTDEQEVVNANRHKDSKESLQNISKKLDDISKKQNETDGRVAKIYTVAGVIGAGAGFLAPYIKDYFIS